MKATSAIIFALLLLAFSLRFYNYAYPSFPWMDERQHVSAAINYWETGQFEPETWEHPPLRQLIFKSFLALFGDNPLGWRIRNILSGTAIALLTFLLAHELCGSRRTALLAGVLIATDPLHVVLSRFTYDEIYGSFFFLGALVLYLKHRQRCWLLALSALFIGCALSIKWNYAPGWLLLIVLALSNNRTYRKPGAAVFVMTVYLLIPATIYLLTYYPWFGRGYSIAELFELISNGYHSLQKWNVSTFNQDLYFLKHASASEWFIKPIIVGQGTLSGVGEGRGEFILYCNNLPIWIFTIPSIIGIAILSVKERNLRLALPALFFLGTYTLYLGVSRPIFLYTSATLLPFAFIAIAYCISRIAERSSLTIYYAALAAILGWNLYLYPLVTAKKVPVAPYRYILDHADIKLI